MIKKIISMGVFLSMLFSFSINTAFALTAAEKKAGLVEVGNSLVEAAAKKDQEAVMGEELAKLVESMDAIVVDLIKINELGDESAKVGSRSTITGHEVKGGFDDLITKAKPFQRLAIKKFIFEKLEYTEQSELLIGHVSRALGSAEKAERENRAEKGDDEKEGNTIDEKTYKLLVDQYALYENRKDKITESELDCSSESVVAASERNAFRSKINNSSTSYDDVLSAVSDFRKDSECLTTISDISFDTVISNRQEYGKGLANISAGGSIITKTVAEGYKGVSPR
jgi:hypothetical protein